MRPNVARTANRCGDRAMWGRPLQWSNHNRHLRWLRRLRVRRKPHGPLRLKWTRAISPGCCNSISKELAAIRVRLTANGPTNQRTRWRNSTNVRKRISRSKSRRSVPSMRSSSRRHVFARWSAARASRLKKTGVLPKPASAVWCATRAQAIASAKQNPRRIRRHAKKATAAGAVRYTVRNAAGADLYQKIAE